MPYSEGYTAKELGLPSKRKPKKRLKKADKSKVARRMMDKQSGKTPKD